MLRHKVFVIGLDGGTFALLTPWMEQGLLPHLTALVTQGVSGELTSTVPPMTAPAWASFMTGKNPGKHAIYDFVAQEATRYRFQPLNAQARRGSCLWEIISHQGGKVVVLNVPMTYPPQPVNGAMVGDFLTPSGKKDFVYPPELLAEIEAQFGPYPLYPFPPYFAVTQADADIDRFLEAYTTAMLYKFRVARFLIERIAPDFFMLHIYGSDQICHWLWHMFDTTHPQHEPQRASRYLGRIQAYFQRFDAEVGELTAMRDQNTSLVVMSDHGFGPLHKVINLNTWLLREGYLVLRRRPITAVRYLLWRLGLTPEGLAERRLIRTILGKLVLRTLKDSSRATVDQIKQFHARLEIFLSLNDVDWSQTRAFCLFGWGQIKINTRGAYPQGCVTPGTEYEALRAEIVDKLRTLRDPETGELVGGEVFTRDEVYWGPFRDHAPDITFLPMQKHYWANSRGTGFPSNRIFSPYLWGMTGMHTTQGMLIAQGNPLRQGTRVQGARIVDLLPSLLYMMGIKIPTDVDGQVLQELFDAEFLRRHDIEYSSAAPPEETTVSRLSGQEEADIIARLRELGYL